MATSNRAKPARKPAARPAARPAAAPKREPSSLVPTGDMGHLLDQGMRSSVTGERLNLATLPPTRTGLYRVRVRRDAEGSFDHFEVEPYEGEGS